MSTPSVPAATAISPVSAPFEGAPAPAPAPSVGSRVVTVAHYLPILAGSYVSLDPRAKVLDSKVFDMFSHVNLVSFDARVTFDTQLTTLVQAGFCEDDTAAASDLFLAPGGLAALTSPAAPLSFTLVCPCSSFGSELKQTVLANDPPSFVLRYGAAGAAGMPAAGTVLGSVVFHVRVACSGSSPVVTF
uniref:Uncharacterized protein n=1 Tax=Lentinula edodes deltaflexivirus 2 TaxID=2778980 RepID=A0A7S7C2K2_9VIRU|nr:hypothetical protein [Lentinula edodes deltaflexivirus 2]